MCSGVNADERAEMLNALKRLVGRLAGDNRVLLAKQLFYGDRGEPIQFGPHTLRYLTGTRPTRLEYINHPDFSSRNDATQLKWFVDNVRPGDVALDIGGHNGQYAVLLGALVGAAGRVVTFEPDPAARAILRRNLELNNLAGRVTVEEIALSDRGGTHAFFSRGGDSMSSLARTGLGTNAAAADVTEQVVTTERLDDYIAARQLPHPKWIKLDTEGAEISILRGAHGVLKSNAFVVCELHPYAWPGFGTTYDELLKIVHECGRAIRYLDPALKIEDGAVYGATLIS